jgi:hypothetical protein
MYLTAPLLCILVIGVFLGSISATSAALQKQKQSSSSCSLIDDDDDEVATATHPTATTVLPGNGERLQQSKAVVGGARRKFLMPNPITKREE